MRTEVSLGPFNALLLSPKLGMALQDVGASVRYRTAFTARGREVAILIVAAHWDSELERSAHESVALSVGLKATELASMRAGGVSEFSDARELACAHLTYAMGHRDVDDQAWKDWMPAVGIVTVFELSL